MSETSLTFITDFADQAVILPLLSVVALVLAAQRRWRTALAWVVAIAVVLGGILALKIVCYACGWLLPALDADRLALRSPSGHAGSAAVVYGAIAALLAPVATRRAAITVAFLASLLAAIVIGVTRVALGAHSLSEVVMASCLGIGGALAFAAASGPDRKGAPAWPSLAGILLVLAIFHGRHLPAEAVIQSAASETFRNWVTACRPG